VCATSKHSLARRRYSFALLHVIAGAPDWSHRTN